MVDISERKYVVEEKIIITRKENRLYMLHLRDDKLLQIRITPEEKENILGNIYIGKIKNIVKNISAAFVEIGAGQVAYLPLKEIKMPLLAGEKLRAGDEVVVQVRTEPVKTKPAGLTGLIELTGKYLVLTRGRTQISLSGKIHGQERREALKQLLVPFKNEEYGFILRTNAGEAEEEQILKEAEKLKKKYQEIVEISPHRTCFSVVYKAPPEYLCELRDGYSSEIGQYITDCPDIYEQMKGYLEEFQPEDLGKLSFYQDEQVSLFTLYNLSAGIRQATDKNVWLKSGAGLVIEPTEALTVIDVNTGKAIRGKKNVEQTFLTINKEAAVEIARQLRLRNLSGIIIVDFIDMREEWHKEELLALLRKEVAKDPVKTVVVGMTALGLVEITRKRQRKPLHEMLKK